MKILSNCYMPILRIDAAEFYTDAKFIEWLNAPDTVVATWHKKGTDPDAYSDLFFTHCHGEGSNSDMPEHIWQQLSQIASERYGEHECLIWLANL